MKTLFIFSNLGWDPSPCIGILTLSAVLKSKAHDVKLIYLNESMGLPLDLGKIQKTIEDYQPSLIGFSATTNQFPVSLKVAKFIKRSVNGKIPILFGGIHTTLKPLEVIKHNCVDMVILGEGEGAILELADRIQGGKDIRKIKNLWLKENGQIIKNDLRPYVSLERVPFMDVEVMDFQKMINLRNGWVDLMLSRGCPRECTYCFNSSYKNVYRVSCKQPGKYVRTDDFFKTINGIKNILSKYQNIKAINFYDDDFLLSPSITEFIGLFRKEIGLPFMVNTHINSITDEKIRVLKNGGCDMVKVGLESGSHRIRESILNRPAGNQYIIEKMKIVRKHGIRLFTFNMIGLPTETENDVLETLKLNIQLQADVVRIATFYPYEGTVIYSLCRDLDLLDPRSQKHLTYSSKSILNFDTHFKLFLLKITRYLDCYLNYFSPDISINYQEIVNEISSLSELNFDSMSKQKTLSEKIDQISKDLSAKSIPHYVKKFNPYYAVRI